MVPQQTAFVIERLGKYDRTITAGWYFLIPLIDRIAYAHSLKVSSNPPLTLIGFAFGCISTCSLCYSLSTCSSSFLHHMLQEESIQIPNQTAITRDNVTITIDGVLYVRINDPYAASYGVEVRAILLISFLRAFPL